MALSVFPSWMKRRTKPWDSARGGFWLHFFGRLSRPIQRGRGQRNHLGAGEHRASDRRYQQCRDHGFRERVADNWLYRRGDVASSGLFDSNSIIKFGGDPSESTTWWVDFSNFFEGVGALGGGNVTMTAGGGHRQRRCGCAHQCAHARHQCLGWKPRAQCRQPGRAWRWKPCGPRAGDDINGGVYYVEKRAGYAERRKSNTHQYYPARPWAGKAHCPPTRFSRLHNPGCLRRFFSETAASMSAPGVTFSSGPWPILSCCRRAGQHDLVQDRFFNLRAQRCRRCHLAGRRCHLPGIRDDLRHHRPLAASLAQQYEPSGRPSLHHAFLFSALAPA